MAAAIAVIGALVSTVAVAQVGLTPSEEVVIRSGTIGLGSRDSSVHCWRVPSSGFVIPVTPAEFQSARNGFPAYVLGSIPGSYIHPLPADRSARWINETGSSSSGNSVLYAIPFDLSRAFGSATLDIDFAVDNTLGYLTAPGVYLNESPLAGSIGGDHPVASHLYYPRVDSLLHVGHNTVYVLMRDTGLDGGIIFSLRLRTFVEVAPPLLSARMIGPPVVRNGRVADYTLELTNSGPDTISSALVGVFVSDTAASIAPAFVMPAPLPAADTTVAGTMEGQVVDGQLGFVFLMLNIPPHATDRSHVFHVTFRLGDRPDARYVVTAVAIPLDGGSEPPDVGLSSSLSAAYPYPLRCVADMLKAWTTWWWNGAAAGVRCIAAGSTAVLQELMNPGAPVFYARPSEDFVHAGTEALSRCGIVYGLKYALRRGATASLFRVMGHIGLLCSVASVLHDCDSRIQNCSQIWDQALSVFVGRSMDPNELVGPRDEAQGPYVDGASRMRYTTFFENLPTAALPAQSVLLVDSLRTAANFDFASLQLERVTLGSRSFDLRGADLRAPVLYDMRPDVNLLLRVTSTFDSRRATVSTLLEGLDPVTQQPPNDARGILPPDAMPPAGEGALSWAIQPVAGLTDGDAVTASARIQFDAENWLATNAWTNTVDASAPIASIARVAPNGDSLGTQVTIVGSDELSGVVWRGLRATDSRSGEMVWTAGDSGRVVHEGTGEGSVSLQAMCRDAVGHVVLGDSITIVLPWPWGITGAPVTGEPGAARWFAYPTPSRDGVLRFSGVRPGERIDLSLFDVLGRRVAEFSVGPGDRTRESSWRLVGAHARSPGPGIYFIRGTVGARSVGQKIVILDR